MRRGGGRTGRGGGGGSGGCGRAARGAVLAARGAARGVARGRRGAGVGPARGARAARAARRRAAGAPAGCACARAPRRPLHLHARRPLCSRARVARARRWYPPSTYPPSASVSIYYITIRGPCFVVLRIIDPMSCDWLRYCRFG